MSKDEEQSKTHCILRIRTVGQWDENSIQVMSRDKYPHGASWYVASSVDNASILTLDNAVQCMLYLRANKGDSFDFYAVRKEDVVDFSHAYWMVCNIL